MEAGEQVRPQVQAVQGRRRHMQGLTPPPAVRLRAQALVEDRPPLEQALQAPIVERWTWARCWWMWG